MQALGHGTDALNISQNTRNMAKHKHRYFLKIDSVSKQQFYRECADCKKVAKPTKYKPNF